MPTGRPHPPGFKAEVVMRVISGEKALNGVAAEYDLNPNLARKWRSKFEREAYRAFSATEDDMAAAGAGAHARRHRGARRAGLANSDQGPVCSPAAYERLLEDSHVLQGMDGKARWAAFVVVERWFRSLKSECVKIGEHGTPREPRGIIDEYVRKRNDRRLRESLDYEAPASWRYSGIAAQLAA